MDGAWHDATVSDTTRQPTTQPGDATTSTERDVALLPLEVRLGSVACRHRLRHYQELALQAADRALASGDRRLYLTMPPGSGKTLLGLEIGRRSGRPIVALAPTTAIQGQWLAQWRTSFDSAAVPATGDARAASGLRHGPAGVLALTYQSIVLRARDDERGRDDQPPTQLHANGQAIIDALAAAGPITLILDECHHLLRLWGRVLEIVVGRLHPDSVVIGLTATPPGELGAREAALARVLFGEAADFEVVTPAVVRDGYLAPYQELALLVEPLPAERAFIDAQEERFGRLRGQILDDGFATTSFPAWFATRFQVRRSVEGAGAGWETVERADPTLAQAALRLAWMRGDPPPQGAHLWERHRREPDTADWMTLLDAWVTEVLRPSLETVDAMALEHVRTALPSVGYRLTRHGITPMASVTDRVLRDSAAKPAAVLRILAAEEAALGDRLRAVVLCDLERASLASGRLRGVLEPGAGSAALVLRTLLATPGGRRLDPVLVTGRTVACTRATAVALVASAASDPVARDALAGFDPLAATSPDMGGPWDDAVAIGVVHPAWTSRTWVPLITRFLESGGTRCLVGTRGLLGEGWDCPAVNVLVDLGSASTRVSMHQVRGRSLRLDPADPTKVADDWDVVCVSPGHERGGDDYARFVRRHAEYFALDDAGEITSGVAHVDARLSPFGAPDAATFPALEARMLARTAARPDVRAAWRIGEPYRDVPVPTLRVRAARSPGLPARDPWRGGEGTGHAAGIDPRPVLGLGAAGAVTAIGAGELAGAGVLGTSLAVALLVLAAVWAVVTTRRSLLALGPGDTLGDMGRAVADALADGGLIAVGSGAASVRIVAQADGYHRCLLADATESDARRFAEALEQVLEPIWDPRWMVPRRILDERATTGAAVAALVTSLLRGRGPGRVVHHAVPDVLARRRDRVMAFERAWGRWVSPGARAMRATDPAGVAVLAAHRGEDPFRIETQLRTLWT